MTCERALTRVVIGRRRGTQQRERRAAGEIFVTPTTSGIRPTEIKAATSAFFFLLLRIQTSTQRFVFSPVGLTGLSFPAAIARDTWSFPGVPSPRSSAFVHIQPEEFWSTAADLTARWKVI